ncbi:hypothetical protein ACFLT4_05465 [Chloroflexota bacterium]
MRNLIFIGIFVVLILIILADIYTAGKVLEPLGYFYLFFAILAVFYGLYPLYVNRRLTRYYWDRTRRHKLSVSGLIFIVFLVLVALIGPLFTQDPTEVNFLGKNLPPAGFNIQQSIYDLKTEEFVTRDTPGVWRQ